MIVEETLDDVDYNGPFSSSKDFDGVDATFTKYLTTAYESSISWLQRIAVDDFCKQQKIHFSVHEEFWLLNRLDVDTSWRLYVAATPALYASRKLWQVGWSLHKEYYAIVTGKIENYMVYWSTDEAVVVDTQSSTITVSRWLMHHKHDMSKMVVLLNGEISRKGRWNIQVCTSSISPCVYDSVTDRSLVRIVITQWKRHQIRAHCASLWHPIVWDSLYGYRWSARDSKSNKKQHSAIALRSMWLAFDWVVFW